MKFLHSDIFLILLFILNIVLLISSFISNVRIKNINNKNKRFMEKLGNGRNIKDDLDQYMNKVVDTSEQIKELSLYYQKLNKKTEKCIQKVGIVRYNAFKDTGSDLSFAICLLDENNNGVVFNGVYSRDMSNIYAKPVDNGQSKYKLSVEEQEAINKAINEED